MTLTDALFDTDTIAVAQKTASRNRGSPGRVRAYIESVKAYSFPQLIAQPASEVKRSSSDQVVRFATNPKRARDKTPVAYLKFGEIYSDLSKMMALPVQVHESPIGALLTPCGLVHGSRHVSMPGRWKNQFSRGLYSCETCLPQQAGKLI